MNANTYLYQYSDFEDCGLYIGDTGKLACSPSKKLKNVYHLLYTNENLCLAQYNAQHGKGGVFRAKPLNSFDGVVDAAEAAFQGVDCPVGAVSGDSDGKAEVRFVSV